MTSRAWEDPNQDSDTDDDDKDKARLAMNSVETLPIVYTTRLEQMSIFRDAVPNIEPKRLLKAILKESKPKFEEYKTISNENYSMYDKMVQKLDDVFKLNKTKGTGDIILIGDDDSELSSDNDMPNRMIVDNVNSTANNMTIVEFEEEDEAIVPTQLFEKIDEDVIIVEKYRSVFLSFSCTNTNATDLYYIDKKGLVTLHNRITINEKFDVSKYVGPTETFILFYCCWYKRRELTLALDELPKETLEFVSERHICILSSCTCCCSPQKLNALKSRNITGTQRNEAFQSKEQVAETREVTVIDDTVATETIKDEPMASQSIEQAMEYEISQLQDEITNAWQTLNKQKLTKEINKRFKVGKTNKWLQKVLSAVLTSTDGTSTSKNVVTAITTLPTQDLTKSSKLLKPTTIYRPDAHMVINVTSKKNYEIYEINRGKLISIATSVNKDLLSREVFKRNTFQIMSNLAEDISLASRESSDENIVSTVTVPCCWYFREVLINARHGAYDFMRQPHTCAMGHCYCCCKSLRLADTNKKIHLYVKNKSFNRLLDDFVDTNDLVQFNNIDMESKREASRKTNPRFEVIVPNTISLHPNISQKQVSSKITKTKNKVTAPVKTFSLGPEFSLLNDQIQIMEIGDDADGPSPSHPPVPPYSQIRPDSHTLVLPTQTREDEEPSSKITLFTPDMACTITTYALDRNATIDELVDSDPLGGTSADVKDYSVDSSFVTKDEIEDNDDTGSRDVESDPLIYANTEEDTAYDPLEVDDTLIEIKDEPQGIPTNPSVVNATFGSATSQNVPDRTVNVEHLISSILERFSDVKLFINEEGHVTADIGVCVSSLTTGELKVLANILSHAQEQVKNLGLVPGTVLRGQIPIPASACNSLKPNTLPSFMVPETNGEMVIPRIENVFSLKDTQEKQPEVAKLRVRPLQELGVTETKTLGMAQANKTLETPKPVSWLQTALTRDMKPKNSQHPVDPLAHEYDPPQIKKFVIPKGQYQSESTQTLPKSCSQQNIEIPTKECRSDCICNEVTKKPSSEPIRVKVAKKPRNHPFAKKFDELKYNFLESRSQYTRRKPATPTYKNPRRNMPLMSAKSANPTSSISAVVISIDSDDDD